MATDPTFPQDNTTRKRSSRRAIHSELIDDLERIREKRLAQESKKKSETDEAAKDDLPPTKRS